MPERASEATRADDAASAPISEIKAELFKALELIETENPTLLFKPTTVGELPALGATVVWGGDTFTVRNVKRLAMAGTPTAARIVVGR